MNMKKTDRDARRRAATLGRKAGIRMIQGDEEGALRLYEKRLSIYERLDDVLHRAATLEEIARVRFSQGDIEEARGIFEEALEVYERLGETRKRALALGEIALYRLAAGDLTGGSECQEQALSLFRSLDDDDGVVWGLISLADVDMERKDFDSARLRLVEAYALVQRVGRPDRIAHVGVRLGHLLFSRGEIAPGSLVFAQVRDAWRTTGQDQEADQVEEMLESLIQKGRMAIRGVQETGQTQALVRLSWNLAHLAAALKDLEQAIEHLSRAESALVDLGKNEHLESVREFMEALLNYGSAPPPSL